MNRQQRVSMLKAQSDLEGLLTVVIEHITGASEITGPGSAHSRGALDMARKYIITLKQESVYKGSGFTNAFFIEEHKTT